MPKAETQARPPEYGGATGSVRRHNNLRSCIESLINRLETIKETNPEIYLDDDIALARRALDDHWHTVQRLAQNASITGGGTPSRECTGSAMKGDSECH